MGTFAGPRRIHLANRHFKLLRVNAFVDSSGSDAFSTSSRQPQAKAEGARKGRVAEFFHIIDTTIIHHHRDSSAPAMHVVDGERDRTGTEGLGSERG